MSGYKLGVIDFSLRKLYGALTDGRQKYIQNASKLESMKDTSRKTPVV